MRTVALIEPLREAELVLGEVRRRRSRAAPRGGSRASGGRGTGRCPCRASRRAVVEEVEAEVEEAARDRSPSTSTCRSGRCQPRGRTSSVAGLVVQPVRLLAGVELDRPLDRVDQVRLALDDVPPGRGVRVLEVGHEAARARVEGVDDHLAVDRAGDLDAAVLEVGRDRRDAPVALADVARLGQEVGQLAGVDPRLALGARGQELASRGVEATVQLGDERERIRAQELLVAALDGAREAQPRRRPPYRSRGAPSRGRGRGRRAPGRCNRPARPS